MKILPPALAFALGLAVVAGTEPRSGAPATPSADRPGGPVLLVVDEQGVIVDTVEASGIADAISAIESSTPASGRLLILLVPVAAGASDPPRAAAAGMPRAAAPAHPTL